MSRMHRVCIFRIPLKNISILIEPSIVSDRAKISVMIEDCNRWAVCQTEKVFNYGKSLDWKIYLDVKALLEEQILGDPAVDIVFRLFLLFLQDNQEFLKKIEEFDPYYAKFLQNFNAHYPC